MTEPIHSKLSRRERQILDVIYQLGAATAAQVYAQLSDPPSDATVRKLIRILEEKGHVTHRRSGREYVYRPRVSRSRASREALRHLVETFFDGSASRAVAALLNASRDKLSQEDVDRLTALIEEAERNVKS